MKRYIQLTTLAGALSILLSVSVLAQDDAPVIPPFETLTLIDNQTTVGPYKGQLVLEIQHRFSQIKEVADLFGIYGSANTRLGFSYGISDKIMLGFGTTRTNMLQDLEWKYNIFTQTESGKVPVSLSYFGNGVLDARDSKYFGPEDDFSFIYRLSSLHQLIASRRFGDKVSIQVAPTFVWYNAVPAGYRNANASINFGGRFQVLGFHSIILEYDQPLLQPEDHMAGAVVTEASTIYPNVSLGLEIGTSTHSFRVFASNYNSIVKNRSIAFNDRNPMDGDFQFGFNITIRF